jgi:hypothetical protein
MALASGYHDEMATFFVAKGHSIAKPGHNGILFYWYEILCKVFWLL